MRYGKFTETGLMQAPNPLCRNGAKTYNPFEALYVAAGYLPIVDTPMPDDGAHYVSHWEEQDGKIIQVWQEVEPPADPEPPSPVPELTPAQKREQTYNTEPIIEWEGAYLTVTEAAQKWSYYAAEGDITKTQALTAKIAEAKQSIREKYPDKEV